MNSRHPDPFAGPPGPAPSASAEPLGGARFHDDSARLYHEMRARHGALVPVTLPGGIPAWLVIGYRELHQVTADSALFTRDMGLWNQWSSVPHDWPLLPMISHRQPSVFHTVGAEHARHLDLVVSALEGVNPFELRRHAERTADALVDAFCGRGEAELIEGFARLLPIRVFSHVIGFPEAEAPALGRAINALADAGQEARLGNRHLRDAMRRLLAAKRAAPGADVASRMLAHPGTFTEEEYALDLATTVAAGHLPTADWIGNTLRLMLTDDRFAASLTGGRHSVGDALNLVLWEDTPTQILAGRWAARDTNLAGRRIQAGDLLLLGLQGAHEDPGVRREAGAAAGAGHAHFAFGHGEFRCPFPAQETAEIIARTGIEVLLDRLPDIDLTVPPGELRRRPSPFLRGLTALPVRFTPTAAVGAASGS